MYYAIRTHELQQTGCATVYRFSSLPERTAWLTEPNADNRDAINSHHPLVRQASRLASRFHRNNWSVTAVIVDHDQHDRHEATR